MKLEITPAELEPIIDQAVARTVAAMTRVQEEAALPDRLLSEEEAAQWLGINWHALRDERRRGKIGFNRIVKNRIRYSRADLTAYLASRHTGPSN